MRKDENNDDEKQSFFSFFFWSISFLCEQSSLVILRCFYIQYKENDEQNSFLSLSSRESVSY